MNAVCRQIADDAGTCTDSALYLIHIIFYGRLAGSVRCGHWFDYSCSVSH